MTTTTTARHDFPVAPLDAARGRWLCLRLAGVQAHQPLWLVVHGTPGHWPDVTLPLQPDAMGASAWVYAGLQVAGVSLQGDPAALAQLGPASCETVDQAPPGAAVGTAMGTAAMLERLGICALHEVALGDDPAWPLVATGSDPQLLFLPLQQPAPRRVALALELETPSETPPVAYWAAPGQAYSQQASAALTPTGAWPAADGVQRCSLQLPRLPGGARWRLDPLAAPGRFRVRSLQVDVLPADQRVPAMRQMLQWLAAHKPLRGCADLVAAADLHLTDSTRRRYLATSNDPQMRLPGRVPAGWYMLEMQVELPAVRGRARVYLDEGSGESEALAFGLPLKSGKTAKRLLWLQRPSRLRLDPVAAAGTFTLQHFSLQRVTGHFARQRLLRKLQQARAAAVLPAAAVPAEPGAGAGAAAGPGSADGALRAAPLAALWQSYCNLFEPHHEGAIAYGEWIEQVERPALPSAQRQAALIDGFQRRPLVSVVVPTFNTPLQFLRECLDSVLAQSYPHWELCIADDASPDPQLQALLHAYAAREPRIRLALRAHNGNIVAASNSALELASGEFVALLDHDDTLAPHALFAVVQALQQRPSAQIIYSDEDKLDTAGGRCEPFFKPDYSPDLLLSQNYVSHLGVYSRALVDAVGRFRAGFEGAQDYDLLLRCVARLDSAADVLHVPQVLYHWRKSPSSTAADHAQKPYATEAARRALQEHADACTPGVQVSVIAPGLYRQHWPLPATPPLVSLIVPTRDGGDTLRACITSVLERTAYKQYEILIVDNQSSDASTLAYMDTVVALHPGRVRVLRYDHPFNYAAINNHAVSQAHGSLIGLINDDVEVINADWLGEMVRHAARPDVGCVGAKLYYPDDTVQHAGVVLGIGGIAGHSHKYFDRSEGGYFGKLRIVHDVSAVTAAALLVKKSIYQAVGGLDAEHLHVAFNDVDFCIKTREAGWRNLFTPFAELYHHESKSRGQDTTDAKRARFQRECETMAARWHAALARDPHYNPNLSMLREDYSLSADCRHAVAVQ